MTRTRALKVCLLLALAFLLIAPHHVSAQQQSGAPASKDSLAKFAGTWEGKCQDGRTFVVVVLQVNGNQLGGTVSIGNMHGDDEGACMLVTAPPAPEHAQKISDVVIEHNTLLFDGSKRPDGTVPRFELRQADPNKAELELLGTPVEKHPWLLEKVQKLE